MDLSGHFNQHRQVFLCQNEIFQLYSEHRFEDIVNMFSVPISRFLCDSLTFENNSNPERSDKRMADVHKLLLTQSLL